MQLEITSPSNDPVSGSVESLTIAKNENFKPHSLLTVEIFLYWKWKLSQNAFSELKTSTKTALNQLHRRQEAFKLQLVSIIILREIKKLNKKFQM